MRFSFSYPKHIPCCIDVVSIGEITGKHWIKIAILQHSLVVCFSCKLSNADISFNLELIYNNLLYQESIWLPTLHHLAGDHLELPQGRLVVPGPLAESHCDCHNPLLVVVYDMTVLTSYHSAAVNIKYD